MMHWGAVEWGRGGCGGGWMGLGYGVKTRAGLVRCGGEWLGYMSQSGVVVVVGGAAAAGWDDVRGGLGWCWWW